MKLIGVILLLTLSASAQAAAPAPTVACGPEAISFKVKLDDSAHTPAPPEPGKARIYFFQDAGSNWTVGYPTVKVALDGAWLGANHGNSYFSASVEPGEPSRLRHPSVLAGGAARGTRPLHRRGRKDLLLPHPPRRLAQRRAAGA